MNLNQLVAGVLSGYTFKAVQLAASLMIVPFLLDPDILGIDDYGRAFALLGIAGIFSIATIGLHHATDRAIAHAIDRETQASSEVRDLLGSTIKIHTVISLICVVPFFVFDAALLDWIGAPANQEYRWAVYSAGGILLFETSLYPLRTPLIARGDIAFVNLVSMLELIGRTVAVFLVFTFSRGSIATLLMLQVVFTVIRQLAYYLRLSAGDRRGLIHAPVSRAIDAIRYAGPMSITEGSTLLVRNVPVILASKFLGATEAGYVAVVANTLQGYILQIFLAVFQPFAVPIASRVRLADASPSRRRRFIQLESAYGFAIAIAFGQAIIWTPTLIPLWLGEDLAVIVFATQIMIAGCGIQTSTLIRRSMLIGDGKLPQAVPVIAGSAAVATLAITVGIVVFSSWLGAVAIVTSHMVVSSSLGIDRVFSKTYQGYGRDHRVPHVVGVLATFLVAWLVGEQMTRTSSMGDSLFAALGFAATTVVGSLTIISMRDLAELVRTLYSARNINLFD